MPNQPNALVIGPMKAGTTWLHDFLETQGNICLPEGVKETFYFDRYFNKGFSWYQSHFKRFDINKHSLIMEVAPSYFHCASAPSRIREHLGDIPLVITLRDPVRRSWSHYLHLRRYGYTRKNLQDAALEFPQLLQASCYATMLDNWLAHFSNIHVIWQEDLLINPEQYARAFCEILNIRFYGLTSEALKKSNEAAVPPSSTIAALGRNISYALRSKGLYPIVNLAKRAGLKRFFFGSPDKTKLPKLSDDDARWLAQHLINDFSRLDKRYHHPDISLSAYLQT